jgi:hypothetical protein
MSLGESEPLPERDRFKTATNHVPEPDPLKEKPINPQK